jgi:hypothetical protein
MFLEANNCCSYKAVCAAAWLWWINQFDSTIILDFLADVVLIFDLN